MKKELVYTFENPNTTEAFRTMIRNILLNKLQQWNQESHP